MDLHGVSRERWTGLLFGLLLPLPLVLLLCAALYWRAGSPPPSDTRISPILSPEERRQFQTFEKPCQRQGECESPLGCVDIYTGGPRFCIASECLTDAQCREGFTCRALPSLKDGPRVRRCVLVGTQKEGQPCVPSADTRDEACEQALLCHAFCGRPCDLDVPTSCPDGFACQQGPSGPSCLPHCKDRACPDGQECIHQGSEFPMCAAVHGLNCQRTPCSEGQRCFISYRSGARGAWVEMECAVPCAEGKTPCAEGFICDFGICRQRCEPNGTRECDSHRKCGYLPVEEAWLCFPK
jgi:hypothetical protein